MPTIDEIYGSDETLRAHHLPAGVSVPVTIERIATKSFDDGKKIELKFTGKQRVLLLNKTNSSLIAKFLGERDYTRWVGKLIWLKASETEFRGDLVPCIRVDLHPPANPAARQPPQQAAAPPAGELSYVPDNPADPGGYHAPTAGPAPVPEDDIPF